MSFKSTRSIISLAAAAALITAAGFVLVCILPIDSAQVFLAAVLVTGVLWAMSSIAIDAIFAAARRKRADAQARSKRVVRARKQKRSTHLFYLHNGDAVTFVQKGKALTSRLIRMPSGFRLSTGF
jgi:membrane protein implicated in regulation of membrane protease activity